VADAFAVHPQTVTGWESQGMPTRERGRRGRRSGYALRDVVAWYIGRELAARGVANGARLDPLHERALLDRQRREGLEFDLAIKRGEYAPVVDLERRFSARVLIARDRFRALPSWAMTTCALPSKDAATLAARIDEILVELATTPPPEEGHDADIDPDHDDASPVLAGVAPAAANGARPRAGAPPRPTADPAGPNGVDPGPDGGGRRTRPRGSRPVAARPSAPRPAMGPHDHAMNGGPAS
jgi:hypothetical protein